MNALTKRLLIGAVAAVATVIVLEVFEAWIAKPEVTIACVDPEERVKVREIIVEGLDGALKDRVYHLFEQWMVDPSEQPKRATVGLTNAINAHIRARKDALRWNPPPCEGR